MFTSCSEATNFMDSPQTCEEQKMSRQQNMPHSSLVHSTTSSSCVQAESTTHTSGSIIPSVKISVIVLLVLTLFPSQGSSMPGASIDVADRSPNDPLDYEEHMSKRDSPVCQRGSKAENDKWDLCERCARTNRSRDTFRLCCSVDAAEKYCNLLINHRPEEFNKRPRARRAPVGFNQLLRSVMEHKLRSSGADW